MSGFCELCGMPLKKERCPNDKCTKVQARRKEMEEPVGHSKQVIGPLLPKPSTTRRLLGSGIEFAFYVLCFCAIAFLDWSSFGILGLLCLVLFGLTLLRDFNAGAFSIAKRVSQMRVVDWQTGYSASNGQAFMRNSYYIVLLLLAVVPYIDPILVVFFVVFIALDITMILASRQGRRLGDRLAGTQVVEARS